MPSQLDSLGLFVLFHQSKVGQDDRPICSCKPNFVGNPLQGCRYECERDNDCSAHQKCEQFRCTAVCDQDACGEGANCRPLNHRAECTCPDNFIGSPQSRYDRQTFVI